METRPPWHSVADTTRIRARYDHLGGVGGGTADTGGMGRRRADGSRTRSRRDAGRTTVEVDSGVADIVPDRDRPRAYTLLLDGAPQSHVDLDDPTYLDFEYMRRIAHVVEASHSRRAELDLLHLGGGALALPRYFAATRPGCRQRVVEADNALVALVRRELPLPSEARCRVRIGDAREALTTTRDHRYDVIITDVFAALTVPAHICSVEFAREARRVLRPGGQYVANIADGNPLGFARSQVATLRAVFGHVCVLADAGVLRGRRFGNLVLAASDDPLPLPALTRRLAGDPFPCRLVDGDDLAHFAAGAAPVSDADSAPSRPPPPGAFGAG